MALAAGAAWWWALGPGLRREAGRVADAAGIRPGMTVADVGAGSGRMAVEIAARVGPSGRVLATEIERGLLLEIGQRAAARGLGNVTPMMAGQEATGLEPGCCDAIYMRRVFHHLAGAQAIAASLHRSLRPGGRLVVIDFALPGHGVPAETVRATLEGAGFIFERRIERWSLIDYCLVFRKST